MSLVLSGIQEVILSDNNTVETFFAVKCEFRFEQTIAFWA